MMQQREPHAVVFDVDGVLVATPHERAWREALSELMRGAWRDVDAPAWATDRFTTDVYQRHVAGKARLAGARAALDYFRIPDAERRTLEYADHKQRMIDTLIDAGEFVAFPDALRLVLDLYARGVPLAAASSSRNARKFMERVDLAGFALEHRLPNPGEVRTLYDVFAADVSGRDVPSKPDPALFLLAARELGVPPARAVVVEDAPSGVAAAKAAGMKALGVARVGDRPLLDAAGADLVVTTLDTVAPDALAAGRVEPRREAARVQAG
jgi:beta-phosphoglucomutase